MLNAYAAGGGGGSFVPGTGQATSEAEAESTAATQAATAATEDYTSAVEDATEETETALEKFQNWLGTLFDWVEVKIERQTSKIDKWISKAETATDRGQYTRAGKYYRNATSETITQIGYEQQAYSKYTDQAGKVLASAISEGVIDSATAELIKTRMASGEIDIAEYSDEVQEVISAYQEWYDKAQDASDAIDELHNNVREYTNALKDLADAQRDATIDTSASYASIASSGTATSTSALNSQLNASIRDLQNQNRAYSTASTTLSKNLNYKRVGSTANTGMHAITDADTGNNKKYQKALNNASKAIKNKKAISSSDLKVIQDNDTSVYEQLMAYNYAHQDWEDSKLEQMVAYAANNSEIYQSRADKYSNKNSATEENISLLESKYSAAGTTSMQNKLVKQQVSQYQNIVDTDSDAVSYFTKKNNSAASSIQKQSTSGLDKTTKNLIKKCQSAAKSGKSIGTSTLTDVAKAVANSKIPMSFYTACVNYNNTLAQKEAAEAQLVIDRITLVTEKETARDTTLQNTLTSLSTSQSIGTSGTAYTTRSKNSQVNLNVSTLKKQQAAYEKATADAEKDITYTSSGSTAKSAYSSTNSALKKATGAYKKALNNAKSAIKSKKAISDSDLSTIKKNNSSLYEELYAYNLAVSNYEAAALEEAVQAANTSSEIYEQYASKYSNRRDALENRIDLNTQKSENADTAAEANAYLDSVVSDYDNILSNDANAVSQFTTAMNTNASTIKSGTGRGSSYSKADSSTKSKVNALIKSIRAAVSSGKSIEADDLSEAATYYSKGYLSQGFYQACLDYNNALEQKEQAEAQQEIDEATYEAEKESIGTQKLENVVQEYDNALQANSDASALRSAQQSTKTTRGVSLTKSDYLQNLATEQETEAINEAKAIAAQQQIDANVASGLWTTTSQAYKDAISEVNGYKTAAENARTAQEEINNAIAQLPYDTIEAALDLIDAVASYNTSVINLKSARGEDLSESDYLTQIEDNTKEINKKKEEQAQAWSDYLTALASSDGAYGGKTADEWLAVYYNAGTAINDLESDNESLKDSLRDDVYWRNFERAHEAVERLRNIVQGLGGLISDEMLYNDDGSLTSMGTAKLATLVKEYELARDSVQDYTDDIANLNDLYAKGQYTEEEYKEELATLQEGVISSAQDMQTLEQSIIDMYESAGQAQLDYLFEIIDARKEDLDRQKEAYDWAKQMEDDNAELASLDAQIAAYESLGDAANSATKAKLAQLKAQRQEKQDEIDDAVEEHTFELSSQGLEDMKTNLQEAFDESMDDIASDLSAIEQLMTDANNIVSASASQVTTALNQLLTHYGINPVTTGIGFSTGGVVRDASGSLQANGDNTIVRVNPGETILTQDFTDLLPTAVDIMEDFTKSVTSIPSSLPTKEASAPVVQISYDSLINVQGDVDKEVWPGMQETMKQAYDYVGQQIKKDLGLKKKF